MIRILVADDHPVVRAGLKQYINDTRGMIVSDEATNGAETLYHALNNDYDLVLLDIAMPDVNGLEILKQLKIQKPDLKILVLTIHPVEQYAIRVLKAGASGYLTKESAPQELISAIRKVASGGRYVSSSLAEELALELGTDREKPLYQALSDREYQVMSMIATGKRLKDIAQELFLSTKTISSYRSRILSKLNLRTNAEIVRYAIDNQLVR